MNTALLIIDAQSAFFEGFDGGPPVFEASTVLANIQALLAQARENGVPVIFLQHTEEGSEFERGSATWLLHPELAVRDDEPVIEKTTPDSFFETNLATVLDRNAIRHLVIAGNQTDFCIDTTCRAAKSRGYQVTLAADAHGTWDSPHLSAAQIKAHHNHVLGMVFAEVLPSAAISLG